MVDSLAQETKHHADKEKQSSWMCDTGLLLQEGVVEGSAACDGLDMLVGGVMGANFLYLVSHVQYMVKIVCCTETSSTP